MTSPVSMSTCQVPVMGLDGSSKSTTVPINCPQPNIVDIRIIIVIVTLILVILYLLSGSKFNKVSTISALTYSHTLKGGDSYVPSR